MRRIVCGLFAMGALLIHQAAEAQPECASPADQAAFEVQALKSELMVLATGCQDRDQYNAFVRRYQAVLGHGEKEFDAYFKRAYGRQGQREHDAYITSLANAQSDVGLKLGTDFCVRNGAIFDEVMSLNGPEQLAQYAAAKDLVPESLGSCAQAAPARAPVIKARATSRKPAKKH